MKRLLPFDAPGPSSRPGRAPMRHDAGLARAPELRAQQCAIPVEPAPQRTALYAIVVGSEGNILRVHEAPIEVVPFRDTDLVHFALTPSDLTGEETTVSIGENTCLDFENAEGLPAAGTPLIVIGLAIGDTVEAEIIAGMDVEARYRSAVLKYQGSRAWHRPMSVSEQAGGD